jgi:predicted esterase
MLPTQRVTVADELGRSIEVYPPRGGGPGAPLVVFLHATCMDPGPVCDLVGRSGREGTFLVCPSGNATCAGAPDWHGPAELKSAFLSRALEKVEQRWGRYVAHDDTLIGWSRGAFAARDILYADVARGAAPRFTSLVLIAAAVSPDPERLRKAGIRRVLFTAGDQDGARPTMKRAAEKLAAAGIPARYSSLGPIGHWLPDDLDRRLAPGIAWVREK